ncbi:MAG: hypothetical protein WAV20_24410 [Blastocatellia bacterium]
MTTAEDLAKFAIAINTNRLVKHRCGRSQKTRDGKDQSYAMGFLINDRDGVLSVFNDGSQAGTRTYLLMMPKKRVCGQWWEKGSEADNSFQAGP